MATFAIPTQDEELAGSMNELVGKLIALTPLSNEITVNTSYGPQQAVRVRIADLPSGKDLGIRLLFWSQMRRAVLANKAAGNDYSVGIPTEQPQANNIDRTTFTLIAPDSGTDWGMVQAGVDAHERFVHALTHPSTQSPDAPF